MRYDPSMATATLTVRDETLDGKAEGDGLALSLDGLAERVTVREIIRARVYQEADDHNRRVRQADAGATPYRGLVVPSAAERQLNGPAHGKRVDREVDWRKQFEVACEAFERNGFLLLIDDRQAESLDDEVTLRVETDVVFVRLTMLVGG
jgi:hypothetical protein